MIHAPRMQDPKFELHWMADSERRHSSVGYRKTTEEISAFTGIPVTAREALLGVNQQESEEGGLGFPRSCGTETCLEPK